MTPREPSGGTAIAAASLAAAGAATALTETVGVIVWPFVVSGLHGVPVPVEWSVALQGVAGSLELILLGVGSTLLFLRRPMGRRMAKAGCVVHLVQGVIVIGLLMPALGPALGVPSSVETAGDIIAVIAVLVPAIITFVLLLLPATDRWLARDEQPAPTG
ncbi:MAG TPA: hypothetical protein VF444_06460 [Pseudonocardiaceae bacterium]